MPSQTLRCWLLLLLSPAILQAQSTPDLGRPKQPWRGFTEPFATVQVAFSQPGRLQKVHIEEGQRVTRGELLATQELRTLPVELALAKLRANDDSAIQAAVAELEGLERRLFELKRLVDSGGASAEEVQRVKTESEVARARVEIAKVDRRAHALEVRRIEQESKQRELRAPHSGFITTVHRRAGEFVLASDPKVVELVQLDPLRVSFFVPVAQADQLHAQQNVPLHLPQIDLEIEGRLERLAPIVDPQSGTLEVVVLIPNPEAKLRAGLQCEWQGQPAP